jgi:serine/threonine-protein kinase
VSTPHDLASSLKAAAESLRPTIQAAVHRCPTCNQHFSGDARFCPFDGDPLVAAVGYRPDADPMLGKVIDGRYEVESVLGEGGMGSVYCVRHRALEKRFALKVMRADLAVQGELAARFIQEAKAAAAIGHPNIVQITDFGQLPNRSPYFVMELLDGTPLSKLIRKGGPLPAGQAVRVLQQAASALAAAHAVGVIHRDLKPDNVHITKNDVVKILDFGVAKMAGAGRLTRTGMVFGTPHYMSPEQASGGDVDHRADIYALGIIMYEMFTGRVPFEADSYMGVLTKHMFMVPEPPSAVNAAARELGALEDVTMKCLEKKPEARFRSMDELIREVESIVQFAGDRLEVVRPSREFKKRPAPIALADELEPPARGEPRTILEVAGVPRGPSPALIALAVVGGLAVLGGAIYGLRRAFTDTQVNADATLVSPVVAPALPSASQAAALPPEPAPSNQPPEEPPSAVPAAATSVRSVTGGRSEPTSTRKSATEATPRPKREHPSPAPPPTSSPPAFGGGDIVNPWAR